MNAYDAGGAPDGALTRAEHLLELHRPQEALRVLAATLAQHPDNGMVLCLAARAELALKEPGRAQELATRAAAAQPHTEYPFRLLALSFSEMGRSVEACEAAKTAVANAPNLWQTHHALAHVCSGVPGKTSVAWDAARRAVELAPHEAETHAVLGRVAVEAENQTAAEESLREALRLNPDHAGARNDLGRLHMLRKDHFGAASHFAHAAASDVRIDVAQHNIDAAIAMAVGRVVFWVSISVFIIGRLALQQKGDVAVGFGYVLLTVLIGLAIWQIVIVVPAARGGLGPYLRLLPHRDKAMTATVGLLVFGMIALMVMCVVPPEVRLWPLLIGVPAVLASRILLEVRANKLKKALEG
jgi:Flp pilus assembly protein TadD